MKPDLYELLWEVETDVCSFLYREFKVFCSDEEAKEYGKRREMDLNEGASIEERAHEDGYYFEYYSACKVREVDGFVVNLALEETTEGDNPCSNSGS